MTAIKAHEVEGFVKRPDISEGIFLVYGSDYGLVREIAGRLATHFSGGDPEALVVLDANEVDADPSRIAVEARTPSLFGGQRTIRVRGTGKAVAPVLAELKDDPGAAIIIEAGNLTPRDPLRALVEGARRGRALPCYPDTDQSLLKVISDALSAAGVRADPDVVALLRDLLGNDREVTRRELEKVTLFAASSGSLTREDVIALCADNAMLAVDEIIDAAAGGHAERLDEAMRRALTGGVSDQQILFAATSHFSSLRRWRTDVEAGASPRDVVERSLPRGAFRRKPLVEQQLRLWTEPALASAGERLLAAAAESRQTHSIGSTHVARALLAICQMAATH